MSETIVNNTENAENKEMYVIKRKGYNQPIDKNKIIKRILFLTEHPAKLNGIDVLDLSQQVVNELHSGINTCDIDEFTADRSANMVTQHPDYGTLAGRIVINNHHKKTRNSFRDKIEELYLRRDIHGKSCPLIADNFYKFVLKNQSAIESHIKYDRDYNIDFFGFKTLEKSYLLHINGKIIERPQDLWMRIAIFIHMTENYYDPNMLKKIFYTYDLFSFKKICQASPTMFNSGGLNPQVFSCFVLGTGDSLSHINKTFNDMSIISKWAGGIGVHISMIRARGTQIRTTNGPAAGIIPVSKIYNCAMCMYDQGGNRQGSGALYIEPHHPEILRFLDLKLIHGDDKLRARDLFYAVWISDLFMKRVKMNEKWSLFCPHECPGLNDVWGTEYENLYTMYEQEGKAKSTIMARKVLYAIYNSMKESGIPYIGFKDTVNRHNMQSNLGIIRSSNLCIEIMLYSDHNEYAVCCLGNIVLPNYIYDTWTDKELLQPESERRQLNHEFPQHPQLNYQELINNTRQMVRNLDNLLEKNYYPVVETARSAFKTRAIGIGVQGLADVFMKFKVPFESDAAADLNKKIFEAIHYGSISESTEICRDIYRNLRKEIAEKGSVEYSPYPKRILDEYPILRDEPLYKKYTKKYYSAESLPRKVGAYPAYLENGGSPLANGKFHWELYGLKSKDLSGMFDWESLREKIKEYGMRHSHLNAAMPTASTSQIMGNIESIEPYKTNIYTRKTQAGEYVVINKFLYQDFKTHNIDIDTARNYLLIHNGSVQNIPGLSSELKALYKTAYEIKQKSIINMARDRQPFIDQSQSMNLFFPRFTFDGEFYKAIIYAWECDLKTGSYYIRTCAGSNAQNIAIDPDVERQIRETKQIKQHEEEICTSCQ